MRRSINFMLMKESGIWNRELVVCSRYASNQKPGIGNQFPVPNLTCIKTLRSIIFLTM